MSSLITGADNLACAPLGPHHLACAQRGPQELTTLPRPTTLRKLAALVAALAIAATGMLAGDAGQARAATATETNAALTVLHTMNYERAANHLPALGWSAALVSSAHRHNLAMAAANVLSHQLPGEAVFSTRISQAGVPWHSAAENIGWSTDMTARGAISLQTAMYGERPPEDGHRLNILSTSTHYVGVDTYIDARTGKIWLTEDFADVAGPAPAPTLISRKPYGNLDSATALPGHKARLVGWSVDPDNRYMPITIGVFYDGHFAGWFHAPVPRPDVASALHAGPMQGYSIVLTLPAGRHVVTTCASNIGAGSGISMLASHTVVV
jgi:uncharacterized protein YkwD